MPESPALPAAEPLRDRWIRQVLAHHRAILWVSLVVTIACGWVASHLRVDPDLRRLLPADHPVLVGLEAIERTFGSTGSVNLVVKGGSAKQRHAFADAVGDKLRNHPLLRDVDDRLPSRFFTEHALYYLSDAEMAELQSRIDAYTNYELCTQAPDLCLLAPEPRAADALQDFIEQKQGDAQSRTGFRDRYEREGIDATVVLLHPKEPAASIDLVKEVSAAMSAAISEVYNEDGRPWSGTDVTYNLVGPYVTKANEQVIIRRDMVRSGALGVLAVVLIIYGLFRSFRAVLVLIVPLCCGVIWSFAVTQLVLERLNLMTSLISTVLMGMGIDAGIHFYTRAKADRRKHDDAEAIRRAFHSILIPLLVASGTTTGAFVVMATSDFPAFREFGMISAWGVVLCMFAMCTVLPALLYLVGIKRSEEPLPRREGTFMRRVLARPGAVFAVVVVVTAVCFQGARKLDFEYNGRALQSDQSRALTEADTHLISRIFGKDIHAGILLRSDLNQTRETLDTARARHEMRKAAGTSVVAALLAAPDLLPPAQVDLQTRKRQIDGLYAQNRSTLERLEAIAEGRDPSTIPVSRARKRKQKADDWDEPLPGGDDWDVAPEPEQEGAEASATAAGQAWDSDPESGDGWAQVPHTDELPEAAVAADHAIPSEVDPAPGPMAAVDPSAKEPRRITQEQARDLVAMFRAQPFTIDDLPAVLLDKVRGVGGTFGIFAYPDFDAADMRKGSEFMAETTSYLDGQEGMFIGETTVYVAMFTMLREEAPVVLGMAMVLIAGFVYWQLRSAGLMLLTLLPLALALWWLTGLLGALGLKLTLFNLPILPAILGIGVDNGIYLTDAIRRTHGSSATLARALQETGGAIVAATLTTVAGFGSFMVADSAGLRGIGSLAALGIALTAVSALIVLPTLWALGRRRRRRRA